MDQTQNILTSISIAIAFFLFVTSIVMAFAAFRTVRAQRETIFLTSITEHLFTNYRDYFFPSDKHLEYNDKKIDTLSKARDVFRKNYLEKGKLNTWKEMSEHKNEEVFPNAVSYRTAIQLQRAAVLIVNGFVPLTTTLSIFGDVIADDWLMCAKWVQSYWEDEEKKDNITKSSKTDVEYHRRHAELVSLAAVFWMKKNWKYRNSNLVIKNHYGNIQKAKKRFKKLLKTETLMPSKVRREFKKLSKCPE